jgi:cysteinyl-tRNA synthetase
MEQWSVKWGWVDRVAAYEDYQEAIRQKVADDVAIQVAIKAAEENARQATLRVDENRHLRTLGRAVALRILQVIGQGALGEMGLRKVKKVNQTTAKDGSFERDETEIKSVFELAGLAVQAIEIGQKLERLDAGKPTDITQGDGDTAQVIELARKALELLENEHVRNAS